MNGLGLIYDWVSCLGWDRLGRGGERGDSLRSDGRLHARAGG